MFQLFKIQFISIKIQQNRKCTKHTLQKFCWERSAKQMIDTDYTKWTFKAQFA